MIALLKTTDFSDDLSAQQVFTTLLVEGTPVDKCADFSQHHRDRVALLIMQLCLREIFEFRYMQTDPNWSNFFYDPISEKVSVRNSRLPILFYGQFVFLYALLRLLL